MFYINYFRSRSCADQANSPIVCRLVSKRSTRLGLKIVIVGGLLAAVLGLLGTPGFVGLAKAQSRSANTPGNRAATVALFEALKQDDAKTVRALLTSGVDPNVGKVETAPAIVYAAAHKSFNALNALLESPVTDVDKTNGKNENALMLASFHGDIVTVRALIARGAEVNKPDWTALHYAATAGHLEIAKFLVEHHAFIDAMSPNKTTPLMMAARHKNPTLARFLVLE